MLFLDKDQTPADALISPDIPDRCKEYFIPLAERTYTTMKSGGVFSQSIKAIHGRFWLHHLFIDKEDYIYPYRSQLVAVLHYMLQGYSKLWLNTAGPITVNENTSSLYVIPPQIKLQALWQPGHYISCHIDLGIEQLALMAEKHPAIGEIAACAQTHPTASSFLPGAISYQERAILKELYAYTGNDTTDQIYLLDSRVHELIRLYIRNISEVNHEARISVNQIKLLYDVKAELASRLHEPLCISTLAAAHQMSVSTLRRIFKAYFNQSIKKYLSRQRAAWGHDLLQHSDRPIKDIALTTGYRHPASFTRAFINEFGYPPSTVRK